MAFAQLSVPTLSSPNDNLTGAYTRQTLSWGKVTNATGYTIEVDTSAMFDSPLLYAVSQTAGTASTQSRTVYNLRYGTTYHWRVRAYNSVDTSGWSVVRTLTTTDQVVLNSPNDNITGANTKQSFYWNNSRGSKGYILELDTAADFSSPHLRRFTTTVDSSSTSDYFYRNVYNMLYGTTYHWRVRSYNSVDTSGWSAVRTLTTTDQVSLYSPSDNTTGAYTRQSLWWYNSQGSKGYIIELDTAADFSSPLLRTITLTRDSSNTSTTQWGWTLYNLRYGTTYHWRVRSYNSVDTSGWSAVRTLTTTNKVALVSPSNGATGRAVGGQYIYWDNSEGATRYLIQIDTSATFSSPLLQSITSNRDSSNTSATSWGWNLNDLRYGTTYYWRVKAYHYADSSEWSDVWHFTTVYNTTELPVLLSPANDSVGVEFNAVSFVWQAMDNMQGYHYEVSPHSTFDTLVASGNTTLTFTAMLGATPSTTYYWRVRGYNAQGNTQWSNTWHFTTADVMLTAPVHAAPADGASTAADVDIAWHPVFGAVTYDLQVSLDNTFGGAVSNFNTADTHYAVSGLPLSMDFYWRVRSNNGNAVSDWSSPWSFTTGGCSTDTATIVHEMCEGDSYDFFGTTYSASGTYSHTLTGSQGCDSVVVLALTVFNSVQTDIYDTTTGTYEWNGELYTASGDYTQNFTTVHGCDSTVTLHLTVTVGIDSVDSSNIRVYSQDGRIVVEGVKDEEVMVFDIVGRPVDNQDLPCGVYAVKVGISFARKVVVMR